MPIESTQNLTGARPVGAMDARTVRGAAGTKDQPDLSGTGSSPVAPAAFQPSAALDPGQAPVDMERVQVIRRAVETGSYPVIPTKIADAMIAAGMLLRAQA